MKSVLKIDLPFIWASVERDLPTPVIISKRMLTVEELKAIAKSPHKYLIISNRFENPGRIISTHYL